MNVTLLTLSALAFSPWPAPLAAAVTPQAPVAEVLLTNVVGAERAEVPGLPGVMFEPGTGTTHFDRVYGHPGGHWILTARADLPPGEDECLIVNGTLVLREGDPAPWAGGSEDCGTLDRRCAINGSGDFVFATNTSASALDDYLPVRWSTGAWGTAAREGAPVPGLPNARLDDAIDSPILLDDGRVGYAADGIDGVASVGEDEVLILGDALLMQEGVSVPAGQVGGGQYALENLDLGDFWAALDGSSWLVLGDLEGPTSQDDVLLVDGAVALQEGALVPASGFAEPIARDGIHGASMDGSGRWFARGSNASTGADWVVCSEVSTGGSVATLGLLCTTGGSITPGSTERWDDADLPEGFVGVAGNRMGDHVLIGGTDHLDPSRDSVVVLNGAHVVAREGDGVDLDGNGWADDGLFIDAFGEEDLVLTDALELLVVTTLRGVTGTREGQALLRLQLDPGIGQVICEGLPNSTGPGARLVAMGSGALSDNTLSLRGVGLPAESAALFMFSRSPGLVLQPGGSQGQLCLSGALGRFLGTGEVGPATADGLAALQVDLTDLPLGGGGGLLVPGDTLYFQVWYRDGLPAGGATNNLTSAIAVTLR